MTSNFEDDRQPSPFLFLTGCPRSGTSLLAGELMRRYDVAIPFETHFIPVFHRWRRLYGDLSDPSNRQRLLADIFLFTRMWIKNSPTFDRQEIYQASILVTEPMAQEIIDASWDFNSLIHAVFRKFAACKGASRYADKSAFFKPVPPSLLAKAVAPIRIVSVVRDGRDVFLSWQATWFGTSNPVTAARMWRRHVDQADAWRTLGQPAQILRYEDLVTNPDKTLAEAARFLGLTPRTGTLEPDLMAGMATAPEHARLKEPPTPKSVGRFVSAMPPWQQDVFSALCGHALARHGYVKGAQATGGAFRRFSAFAFAWISSCWGGFGREVKFLIPAIFHFGGRRLCRLYVRR